VAAVKLCLTLDLDFENYFTLKQLDEFDGSFDFLKKILSEFSFKTTWYIRIDSQIEKIYGSSDFIFRRHKEKILWLQNKGHEIGWHHHAYKFEENQWKQNTDTKQNCEDILKYGEIAKDYGLISARMGWGFHTNETIYLLDKMGFSSDSSAIPRPRYEWEMSIKDWHSTPQFPYQPDKNDYRIPGKDSLTLFEIPMTTTQVPSPIDTETVLRYLNPAYYHTAFKDAFDKVKSHDTVVLICHPYEIFSKNMKHPLLAFCEKEFRQNLIYLVQQGVERQTISQLVHSLKSNPWAI
jgi:hypothetical protein